MGMMIRRRAGPLLGLDKQSFLAPDFDRSRGRYGSIVRKRTSFGRRTDIVVRSTQLAGLDGAETVVLVCAGAEAGLRCRGGAQVEGVGHFFLLVREWGRGEGRGALSTRGEKVWIRR